MRKTFFRLPTLLLLLLLCAPAISQPQAGDPDISARELIEKAQQADELEIQAKQKESRGSAAQSTPLSAMIELREDMRARDYAAAANFLDRRYIANQLDGWSDQRLAKALSYVWNQQNILDITTLSDDPEGNLDDGLPKYRDKVGEIRLTDETIPVYLQRVPGSDGALTWKISNATVARIPDMWAELGYSETAYRLGSWLPDFRLLGMENWQVVGMVLSFLVAWPLAMLASYLLMRLALLIPNHFPNGIRRFFRVPIRFFIFLVLARALIGELGLSLTTRILLESSGIDYVAFTVLLLGSLTLLRDYKIRKLQYAGNAQYVALLKPMTTIVKILLVTLIVLVWANQAGYNMTTILAGLGVGSLAVALAAQKTLENLIGAITLYAARPVSAGDFCRFGSITGTVEEIGLRSTLIRTLDRTMVVIPNSVFSSQEIENYSRRDRIRYYRRYQVALPDSRTLGGILDEVRTCITGHEKVIDETVSVRFEEIRDANAILRLDAGVDTRDYQEFLRVAEELNLGIMQIAETAGVRFTGPGVLLQGEAPGAIAAT